VKDKERCSAFWGNNGRCTVCKCPYTDHFNSTYHYTLDDVKVSISNWDTNKDLKKMYEKGKSDMSIADAKLHELRDELKSVEKKVTEELARVQMLRNELERVALRPQLSTVGDYVDQLIQNEEESKTKDKEKLALLKELKNKEDIISKLQASGKLTTDDFYR